MLLEGMGCDEVMMTMMMILTMMKIIMMMMMMMMRMMTMMVKMMMMMVAVGLRLENSTLPKPSVAYENLIEKACFFAPLGYPFSCGPQVWGGDLKPPLSGAI